MSVEFAAARPSLLPCDSGAELAKLQQARGESQKRKSSDIFFLHVLFLIFQQNVSTFVGTFQKSVLIHDIFNKQLDIRTKFDNRTQTSDLLDS